MDETKLEKLDKNKNEEETIVKEEISDSGFDAEALIQVNETLVMKKEAGVTFSKIGWSFFAFLISGMAAQIFVSGFYSGFIKESGIQIENKLVLEFLDYCVTLLPMYLVGFPILLSGLKYVKKQEISGENFGFIRMLKFFLISLPIMYLGNIISLGFAAVVERITGKTAVNNISEMIGASNPWMLILFVVIIGPVIEEIIFRRIIIDRTVGFGEKNAIILSAIMFGLFHMNLFQFFYATALGLIFGYMYVKTGKLRYTIILHMIINFMGSVVAVFMGGGEDGVLKLIQEGKINEIPVEQFSGLIILSVYSLFVILACIVGIVLIILNFRRITLDAEGLPMERRELKRLTYGNFGIAFFFGLCIVMMVVTTFMQLQ